YQLDFHEHYWKAINERPWVAGSAVWNMFDFGSFVKLGNMPRINQKGLCDMSRNPKDAYYFYQSQWTDKLMVYIVSHTREHYFGAAEPKNIRVYSNGDRVELFLNDHSLGSKNDQYVYRWEVNFSPGQNNLRAVAYKDVQVIEDQIDIVFVLND
ncbi:MAG: glycoside hydrolase family 2 protein, partial [Candidatus Marinimicrobia bacterium]|nr:glycoside hydrolase family 2 protein [Candidatus Neomarinimicrobiota bacterium]